MIIEEIQEQLFENQDKKYQAFQSNLTPTVKQNTTIGVRTPQLRKMAKEFKYRDIIKYPEYRKLLFSGLINRFGDAVDAIAFTWLVYEITHSASKSAAYLL